ncbi:unnamed protein product [marine sediment metagenome]|uniref:Uncharacterized protein n=1 Tax=marine sediment metagenome TaxID=412755 RepID=X1AZQ9_9ZZZZ
MRDDDKIQRQVDFMHVQIFDPEDTSGKNNTWVYNRAPEGYKFELVAIDVTTDKDSSRMDGIVNIYDGHEYTRFYLSSHVFFMVFP